MSHRLPASPNHGPTPGLSQYSGPPAIQPNQTGPASAVGASYHTFTVQPQEPLAKGPKAAGHQDRKSEVPSTSAPWKDPRETAAASAGHKRSLKDGVLARQSQSMGPPPPPSERPTRRKEGVTAMRQAKELLTTHEREMQAFSAEVDSLSRRLTQLESRMLESRRGL